MLTRPILYHHTGIRQPVGRSTLADANERRHWHIVADLAHVLIQQASALYADEPFEVELQQAAYRLDSTTVDLCLSLFPWAKFRRHKAAIKLHTLLTLRGNFPAVAILTTGKVHDVTILDSLSYEAGSFYIFDRGCLDFGRLHRLRLSAACFVTRAKQNFRCQRRCSLCGASIHFTLHSRMPPEKPARSCASILSAVVLTRSKVIEFH